MERLRCDLRWKVAAGLPLSHARFQPTTLTYWRSRLRAPDRQGRIFDAVATQDTVTQLLGQIRRARLQVPKAAVVQVIAHDYTQAGKPVCDWRDRDASHQLITALVTDAHAILEALEDVAPNEGQAGAVGLLTFPPQPYPGLEYSSPSTTVGSTQRFEHPFHRGSTGA